MDMRCYENGGMDYDLDELKNEWLTGCPLCGGTCWVLPKAEIERIDKELDAERYEI